MAGCSCHLEPRSPAPASRDGQAAVELTGEAGDIEELFQPKAELRGRCQGAPKYVPCPVGALF